jgi:hypothetical protein
MFYYFLLVENVLEASLECPLAFIDSERCALLNFQTLLCEPKLVDVGFFMETRPASDYSNPGECFD